MNLPEIAVRRPVFAWMLMAALIIFGLLGSSRMGISQLPDVDFPVVSINVNYPGAAPELMETNPDGQPIMWLARNSYRQPPAELMRYVKDVLKDQCSSVSGVGEILLGGYVDPNLRVWVSGRELGKYELAVTDVLNAIQNEHS